MQERYERGLRIGENPKRVRMTAAMKILGCRKTTNSNRVESGILVHLPKASKYIKNRNRSVAQGISQEEYPQP